ncbi:LuxR C-terminal-related transcriptional regulator [Geodermatophilus sp. SYSU D00814]
MRGLSALGAEDFDEAHRQLSAICPAGSIPLHDPIALAVGFDLVDAAVRTGHRDAATRHAAALRALPLTAGSPRLALTALGAAPLAGDDSGLFEAALAQPGAEEFPFEYARVQLAYGERLRRLREVTPARKHLTLAHQSFDYLGARPWAVRAERELRATGITRGRRHVGSAPELTSMEREIAELAAGGASNKEIGERLYMSPRTVGSHLYRIFPKLGVASRGGLRDALNAAQRGTADDRPDRTPAPSSETGVRDSPP